MVEMVLDLLTRDLSALVIEGVVREDREAGVLARHVWVAGPLHRIEEPPGRMEWIEGERTTWRSWPSDQGVVALPRPDLGEIHDHPTSLLARQERSWWAGLLGVGIGAGPRIEEVTFLGRAALAATTARPGPPMQVIVDRRTGIELRHGRADQDSAAAVWTRLTLHAQSDPAWFVWDGPWKRDENWADYPAGWTPR